MSAKEKPAYKLAWLLVLSIVVLGGCAGPIYEHGRTSSAASVSDYSTWRIYGDLLDLPKAIDGNINTAAYTSGNYANAAFTIDLGKPCLFNMVVVDQGLAEMNFPRRIAVYLSMDGRNFTYVYSAPGTRRVTVLNWVKPEVARFIRVQAIVPSDRSWSVAEVYVQ
ncbi:MAG: discoidin domain-containing protein [Phycisphaerae bacterium]